MPVHTRNRTELSLDLYFNGILSSEVAEEDIVIID